MSWFKKVVSRILGDEVEEPSTQNNANKNYNDDDQYKSLEQFENDYELNNIENQYIDEEHIEDAYIQQQQIQNDEPNFIRKRESFNFPLIPDENDKKRRTSSSTSYAQHPQSQNVDVPDWLQSKELVRPVQKGTNTQVNAKNPFLPKQANNQRPEAYTPFSREPRGLRGVVKKTDREHYNPFNPNWTRSLNQNNTVEKQPSDLKTKTIKSEPVTPSHVPKKKKFVPTDVPSPIYGFQKRPKSGRDIYDLLDKKEKNDQNSSKLTAQNEVAATIVTESTVSSVLKDATKSTSVNSGAQADCQDNRINETKQINVDSNVFEKEQDSIQSKVKDVQVQNEVNEHIVVEKVLPQEPIESPIKLQDELVVGTEPLETKDAISSDKKVETNVNSDKIETIINEGVTQDLNDRTEKSTEECHDEQEVEESEITKIQQSTIEDSTTSVEADLYTQMDSNDNIFEEQTQNESDNAQNCEEPVQTGSRIPFNVVMLKSDKKKMEKFNEQTIPLPGVKSWDNFKTNPVQRKEELSIEKNLQEEISVTLKEKVTEDEKVIEDEPVVTTVENPIVSKNVKQEEKSASNPVTFEQQSNTIVEQEPPQLNNHLEKAISYLEPPEEQTEDFEWMDAQGAKLIEALSYFQIEGEIVQIVQGPAVTQFEITVGHGVKVSKIRNLADDLKLALAAKDIRIQAPIPGKSSIGIEIPNRTSRPVRLSEVVTHESFVDSKSPLEAALGLDLTGEPVTIDLRKMPHGMIAGATGSGKSVCINSLLISLLLKASPQDVKLMLIDPKMVELAPFNHIPHLVSPVITDVKAATAALKWAVEEMDRRYQLFAHLGARDITRYNKMVEKERKFSLKMPYLVIVIDELADLMMMSPQEVEESICRIAQKARACGIHLVLATQRPSVDVITGLIKSNIPTRIAFSVSSHVDSRTILDSQGAERLLGRGDMLYLGNGMSAPVRVQGTYVTDEEIEAVTNYVRTLGEPDYLFEQEELLKKVDSIEEQDELFEEACRYICSEGSVSASSLQRKYRIGYNRAARLVDMMEAQGFISESKGTKPRDVFLTENDLEEIFGSYDV